MNLFVAWRDSLTLFKPNNFKLFFLVTLKSMVDTFKVWIKYFWWILVLGAANIALQQVYSVDLLSQIQLWLYFNAGLVLIFMPTIAHMIKVTLLLAARPSTALKNCRYFRSYFWRFCILSLSLYWAYLAGLIVPAYLVYKSGILGNCLHMRILLYMIGILWSYYIINYALFYLDGDGSLKSFFKSWLYAGKMTLFNLPFYSVIMLVNTTIYLGFTALMSYAPPSWFIFLYIAMMILSSILEFFVLCLLTNFYVKKLHDQFTLYYGKNV